MLFFGKVLTKSINPLKHNDQTNAQFIFQICVGKFMENSSNNCYSFWCLNKRLFITFNLCAFYLSQLFLKKKSKIEIAFYWFFHLFFNHYFTHLSTQWNCKIRSSNIQHRSHGNQLKCWTDMKLLLWTQNIVAFWFLIRRNIISLKSMK